MRRFVFLIVLVCLRQMIMGQEIPINLEDQIESTRIDADYQSLETADFQQRLNLNKASRFDFEVLTYLDTDDIERLIQHRENFGNFLHILELQQLNLTPIQLEQLVKDIFVVSPNSIWVKDNKRWTTSLTYSLKSGIEVTSGKCAVRNRYSGPKGVQASVNFEKDAGEQWWLPGTDYSSFALLIPHGRSKVFLGDFDVNLGEGLIVGQGFRPNKSVLVMNISNRTLGVKPHRSLEENEFFRGIAVQSEYKNWKIIGFISSLRRDAIMDSLGIRSPTVSGLHRSEREISQRDAAQFKEAGTSFNRLGNRGILGFNFIAGMVNPQLVERSEYSYIFQPIGQSYSKVSVNHQINVGNIRLFGEMAMSDKVSLAIIQGAQLSAGKSLDFAVSYRRYGKRFNGYHSGGFSESGKTVNESGLYLASRYKWKSWMFRANFDMFKFSHPGFGQLSARLGSDYLIEIRLRRKRQAEWYVRYSGQNKESFVATADGKKLTVNTTHKLRWNYEQNLGKKWRFRFRMETILSGQSHQKQNIGRMIYSDIRYLSASRFSMNYRLMLVNGSDFDSRVYVYENDVPFSFSIPSYFGKRIRSYALLRLHLSQYSSIYIKFAMDKTIGNSTLNRGEMYIAHQNKKEIKIHIQQRF